MRVNTERGVFRAESPLLAFPAGVKHSSNIPKITAERDVPGGRRIALELVTKGEPVPGIMLVPDRRGPVPAALLFHGFSSRKERMAETIGRALLRNGVASLAIDLPMHGARAGAGEEINLRSALKVAQIWRLANDEAHQALLFLAAQPTVDASRIALVGYSLGAFLAVHVATDPLVRVILLAAGGDLPETMPFVSVVRTVVDPLRAVRKLAGKPLLMVNGSYDRTIRPEQARRLFDAAAEPKQIVWYAGGHWPPDNEVATAAEWLAGTLHELQSGERTERSA